MGRNDVSECRLCGQIFYGLKPGKKAPVHTSGRFNKQCGGSKQGTVIHVP